MAFELVDRQKRLFGRAEDLQRLLDRASHRGLTAVVARPQMGKSWLLAEFARQLAEHRDQPYLVGFARFVGQTPDLLLRAIVDLYQRWLTDSSYWQQAKMVWDQQKEGLLPGFAKVFAKIVNDLPAVGKPIGTAIGEAINGLIEANVALTSGGVQLPSLQYEQARDLVKSVADITGSRIALFLDQWEDSPDPAFEAKTLNAFLRDLDDWPRCHVFLALRADADRALNVIKELVKSRPGSAEIYPLDEIKLDDEAEATRLLDYLRETIPAISGADRQTILDLIGGYPGVIYQWTGEYQRARMKSLNDLTRVADDAQKYRFEEVNALLPALEGDRRRMAVRIALLPLVAKRDAWIALQDVVWKDLPGDVIDDLKLGKVLERADPPSLGHAKRREAAMAWLIEYRSAALGTEGETLILGFAQSISGADIRFLHAVTALASLLPTPPCD